MSYIIKTKYTKSGQCRLDKIKQESKDCYFVFSSETELTYLVDKNWILQNSSKILNISVVGDKIVHKKHISECILSYWKYYSGSNQGKSTIGRVLREYELELLPGLKKKGYDSVIIDNAVVGMHERRVIKEEVLVFDESQIHIIAKGLKSDNPYVYYHNTHSDFRRFDKSFIGSGYGLSYGAGFYFSSEPIKEYGKTIMVCLDLNKSYRLRDINSFDCILKYLLTCM